MAVKPSRNSSYDDVNYTAEHWEMLTHYREKAVEIIIALEKFSILAVTHGSIARGDVTKKSDIDVFIPETQNSFLVETALETVHIPINNRLIVQATPNYAMKAHIEINEQTTISFPLMEMRRVEREFYQFGGEINLSQLKAKARVPGVDKRLMLIEPTEKGHLESSIIGREEAAAKILGISAETVSDRVRALLKRDSVGRTGVFVKREVAPDETFELALKKLSEVNPAVRRRMKK